MSVSTSKNPYTGAVSATDLLSVHDVPYKGNVYFVDGTNGDDNNTGLDSWANAKATIQAAVTAASAFDTVVIAPIAMAAGATDPGNYAETIIIPATTEGLRLVGYTRGRTQGGLPQIKKGSGSTALLTIRAPGCLIQNLGFNGGSSTGGGILLDDDGSTKTAFGTTIENCHFKNCVGSTATNAATGGAIQWASTGGAFQVLIKSCRFYKNVGDIVVKGTGGSVPQDVVIEDCVFSGPPASVDCNIYVGGSGVDGITIRNCDFQQKPAVGSGTNAKFIVLPTGSVGMIAGCRFGAQSNPTGGTQMTWKASGTAADFPTTVHIAGCFGQTIADTESGEISIAS